MDIYKHLSEFTVAVSLIEIPLFVTLGYKVSPILLALLIAVVNITLIIMHLKTKKKGYVGYIIFLMLPIILMIFLSIIIISIGKMC